MSFWDDEILVGYLEGSKWHSEGVATIYAGRCIGCGHQVFVNPSALELFRSWDHDPKCVCEQCDMRSGDPLRKVNGITGERNRRRVRQRA